MKLIFHIARKDAARIRWLWLAWLGVLAAKLGLALLIALGDTARFRAIPVEPGLRLLDALDAVLVYLLAAWVMLEDAPMNDRHFGRTRPPSRGTLFAAKIVGALTLFWLPAVVVWFPWWIYCGFTVGDMLAEAGVTLAGTTLVVLPAFLLASLVDSFRRLLLWTPVWMGALVIALPIPLKWAIERSVGARGPGDDLDLLGLWQSRILLAGAVLVGGAALLLVWQFLRRRPRETVTALAAGFALALIIVVRAPWNFWPDGGKWSENHPERARDVNVEWASARLDLYHGEPHERASLDLRWRANTPPDVVLRPLISSVDIRSGGDKSAILGGREGRHDPYHLEDEGFVFARMNLDTLPARPDGTTKKMPNHLPDGEAPPADARDFTTYVSFFSPYGPRPEDAPLRLRSRMLLAQLTYKTETPQPAKPGVVVAGAGRRVRITEVWRPPGGISVRGLDTRRARLTERGWAESFIPLATIQARDNRSSDGLALVDTWNREQGPWMDLIWWRNRGTGPDIGGARVRRFRLAASPPNILTDAKGTRLQEPITD